MFVSILFELNDLNVIDDIIESDNMLHFVWLIKVISQ
jgi:hypothetical protein